MWCDNSSTILKHSQYRFHHCAQKNSILLLIPLVIWASPITLEAEDSLSYPANLFARRTYSSLDCAHQFIDSQSNYFRDWSTLIIIDNLISSCRLNDDGLLFQHLRGALSFVVAICDESVCNCFLSACRGIHR